MVETVFGLSLDEPRVSLFSKSLFSKIVVYFENVSKVGFVPCLWLIWHSKLGRVGCRVNGTLPGRFLVKNSTNGGKGEPRHATACSRQAAATLQHGTTRYGVGIHSSFPILCASKFGWL